LLERFIKRTDRKERKRIDSLAKSIDDGKEITSAEIFDSEIIPRFLEERPLSFIDGFRKENPMFPVNCLLFSKVLVTICPHCSCNENAELIEPYLERQLILPILTAPLSYFETRFADLVVQYPYVGPHAFNFIKWIQALASEENTPEMCPHCFGERAERILKKISESKLNQRSKDYAKGLLEQTTFPLLTPTASQETEILSHVEEAVDQEDIRLLSLLAHKAQKLHSLRSSQIFAAIPEVAQDDLSNIDRILQKSELSIDPSVADQIEEEKRIIEALNIDYNPELPVEDYLDIVLPRKKKINSLLDDLISGKGKDQRISEITDEVWRINEEISSSKAIESLTFLTNFVSNNAKILFGMLIGGLIGYSSGSFAGCGLGGIGGIVSGIFGKYVSKRAGLKVPKYPRRTIEWIREKIESPEERLLSIMLAKDIRVIQTWALRKRLKKNNC